MTTDGQALVGSPRECNFEAPLQMRLRLWPLGEICRSVLGLKIYSDWLFTFQVFTTYCKSLLFFPLWNCLLVIGCTTRMEPIEVLHRWIISDDVQNADFFYLFLARTDRCCCCFACLTYDPIWNCDMLCLLRCLLLFIRLNIVIYGEIHFWKCEKKNEHLWRLELASRLPPQPPVRGLQGGYTYRKLPYLRS